MLNMGTPPNVLFKVSGNGELDRNESIIPPNPDPYISPIHNEGSGSGVGWESESGGEEDSKIGSGDMDDAMFDVGRPPDGAVDSETQTS